VPSGDILTVTGGNTASLHSSGAARLMSGSSSALGAAAPALSLLGSQQWQSVGGSVVAASSVVSSIDSGSVPSSSQLASSNIATPVGAPALPQGGAGVAGSVLSAGSLSAVPEPEPGTVMLLLVGSLCGLAMWLKRRK
jgi:hypothetical protein